jgi:thioredoxin 1
MTFNELITSEKLILMDFSAEWCGPCKMMAPMLKELAGKIGDKAKIVKIDVDQNRQIAETLRINAVPTLVLFKNGEIAWRQSGVVPVNVLEKLIDQHNAQ